MSNSLNPYATSFLINNAGSVAYGSPNYGPGSTGGEVTLNKPLYFTNPTSSNYISLQAPSNIISSSYTWPTTKPTYGQNALISDNNGQFSWTNANYQSVNFQASNGAPYQQLNNEAKTSGFATTDSNANFSVYLTKDGTSNGSNLASLVTDITVSAPRNSNMTQPSQFPAATWMRNGNTVTFTTFIPGGNVSGTVSTVLGGGPGILQGNLPISWRIEYIPA